jgi:hypothetical protein
MMARTGTIKIAAGDTTLEISRPISANKVHFVVFEMSEEKTTLTCLRFIEESCSMICLKQFDSNEIPKQINQVVEAVSELKAMQQGVIS